MNPRAILREAADRGVTVRRSGPNLKVRGPVDALEDLRPRIAAAKPAIIAILTAEDEACGIVAATLAVNFARAVAAGSGWMCARCQRIGRVDANAICTFCQAAAQ
jgi:hypothetical protein